MIHRQRHREGIRWISFCKSGEDNDVTHPAAFLRVALASSAAVAARTRLVRLGALQKTEGHNKKTPVSHAEPSELQVHSYLKSDREESPPGWETHRDDKEVGQELIHDQELSSENGDRKIFRLKFIKTCLSQQRSHRSSF